MDLCRRSGKSPLPFFSTPPPLDYPNFLGFGSNCSNGTADWVVYYIELCIKFLSTQIVSDVSYRVLKIVQSTLFDKKFSCNLESTSDLVPKLQSLDYCLWVVKREFLSSFVYLLFDSFFFLNGSPTPCLFDKCCGIHV